MTADLTQRLDEIGAVLAEKMPGVLDATVLLLESVPPVLDAARFDRYELEHQIGVGGHCRTGETVCAIMRICTESIIR